MEESECVQVVHFVIGDMMSEVGGGVVGVVVLRKVYGLQEFKISLELIH